MADTDIYTDPSPKLIGLTDMRPTLEDPKSPVQMSGRLATLPPEVRIMIYKLVLISDFRLLALPSPYRFIKRHCSTAKSGPGSTAFASGSGFSGRIGSRNARDMGITVKTRRSANDAVFSCFPSRGTPLVQRRYSFIKPANVHIHSTALLRTCRWIFDEAQPVLYTQNDFVITSFTSLITDLKRLGSARAIILDSRIILSRDSSHDSIYLPEAFERCFAANPRVFWRNDVRAMNEFGITLCPFDAPRSVDYPTDPNVPPILSRLSRNVFDRNDDYVYSYIMDMQMNIRFWDPDRTLAEFLKEPLLGP
ncbi:MAG: hypothetical protein M1839_009602 [Geoglossum umbratile]|nr:MAG: hypothetical protein M1839_009602 [Geoglossum umbratile]